MDVDEELARGLLAGVVATIAMSVPMIAATAAGVSPMPEPVPKAIAAQLLGAGAPMGAILALAIVAHLGYGGFWGAVLTRGRGSVGWIGGLALAAGLWVVMGLAVLPALGWGLFGTGVTPRIAVATLLLHLVYGVALAWSEGVLATSAGSPHAAKAGEGV